MNRPNLLPRRLAEGHRCVVPFPGHKMHLCRCGVAWNSHGLTYREWRTRNAS